ncbi:MAG TPA: hypothetical protein VK348_13825 [Planctomycetota bacterium]|nr:hypothetical protein [Planctomycetota bacterium]
MAGDPPYPTSVCHGCRWLLIAASRTSTFLRCTRPGWPKYPPQPLLQCHGREPLPPSPGATGDRERG